MNYTQRICDILEAIVGIPFDASDSLRLRIPNSLMLMQAILALESKLNVSVDLASLDYQATVADLAGVLIPNETAVPSQEQDAISLSPIQLAYLLGAEEDIELGGQATFIYTEVSYTCTSKALRSAVETVILRHDVFTYEIDIETGSMRPGVNQASIRLSGDSSSEACLRVRQDMLNQARASNSQTPLVSIHICGENKAKLFAYFNMIIMDAGSIYIFFEEIDNLLAGKSLMPAMSFSAAVRKSMEHFSADRKSVDLSYWEEKTKSLFPTPVPIRRIMGTEDWHTVRLSKKLVSDSVSKLEGVAEKAKTSLSSLILAGFSAVVARWLNVPGITCNVTVSRRTGLDVTKSALGDFTSSMLVGISVHDAESCSSLAAKIGRDIYDGLAHGSVSGVEVMATQLRPVEEQQFATAPIVFTSYLGGDTQLEAKFDHIYTQTAQVSLDMQVMPMANGEINISWDYVPQYFPFALEMFERSIAYLHEVLAGHGALPLTDPKSERIARKYNMTESPVSQLSLLELVEASVSKFLDKPALLGRKDYSYGELWERSSRLAHYLRKNGVGRGDRVIIEFTRDIDDIVSIIATLRVGAAYVPIAGNLPSLRKEAIYNVVSGALVITTEIAKNTIMERENCEFESTYPYIDDIAYIIFTSGSTGVPKGVEITHKGAVGTILDINARYCVGSADCLIGLSSLGFDLSVYDVFGTLSAGATLVMIEDERDADAIVEVLEKKDITLWNSAPALMELTLLRCEEGQVFDSVKTVMLSGDRIPSYLPSRIKRTFPNAQIHSLGGATEASIWSIHYPLEDNSLEHRIPYGYPLNNQGIHILGYDKVVCPQGVQGEIWISGIGLAAGYAGDPELTESSFQEVPGLGRCYRTGDIGVMNHENFVEFIGRRDRQVKIAGYRIELGEIESVLSRSGLVISSAAFISERSNQSMLICAYVPAGPVDESQIRGVLAQHLPIYMIPKVLVSVPEFPLTANGKLDQGAVIELTKSPSTPQLPKMDREEIEILRKLFEQVLGESVEKLDESFFSLGGDSLKFQVLLREISKKTGKRLHFRDVIKDPCVNSIARLLKREQEAFFDDYVQLPSSDAQFEPFPLTDMQMAYYVGRNQSFDLGGVGEHYYIESITKVNIKQLEYAFNVVIQRHDMLRAVLTDDGRQRILPQVPQYHIEVHNLMEVSEDELAIRVAEMRGKLSHQRFELTKWPLFHVSAFALPDGTYRLFFSVDMIIGDGASQRIFIRDLTRAYENKPFSGLVGSYRDYVLATRALQAERDSRPFNIQTERLLNEFPLGNVLPQNGDLIEAPHMRRMSLVLPQSESSRLEERARREGVSLSTVLLSAYAISLALFSRQGKVGVNVTTYNRDFDLPGIQNVFGDFTGIILLSYNDINSENILGRVQSHILEQLNEGRSGIKLLAEMGRRQNYFKYALAPFVFTSLLFDKEDYKTNILGSIDYAISQTPQVLVDHQVMRVNDDLVISWDYVEQAFDPALVRCVFDYFKLVLESFANGGTLEPPLPSASARILRNIWAKERTSREQSYAKDNKPSVSAFKADPLAAKIRHWLREDHSLMEVPDMTSSLFNAGLDSLGFVQLVQRVQKETGKQLPLAQALATPTIQALIELVGQRKAPANVLESVALLREGNPEHVVVMVHGGFGSIDIYRDLALGLPRGIQVLGLQFDRFAEPWPQNLTAEKIASCYADEVMQRTEQASEIAVVGWSVGGTLGHALALQLQKRCVGLVLLDSLAPGFLVEVGDFTLEGDQAILKRAGVDNLEASSLPELWSGFNEDPKTIRRVARTFSPSLFEDLGIAGNRITISDLSNLRTLIAMRNKYRAHRCSIPTLLVVPDDGEAHNYLEWKGYVGETSIKFVQGNHYSFVIGPDSLSTTKVVNQFIKRVFGLAGGDEA